MNNSAALADSARRRARIRFVSPSSPRGTVESSIRRSREFSPAAFEVDEIAGPGAEKKGAFRSKRRSIDKGLVSNERHELLSVLWRPRIFITDLAVYAAVRTEFDNPRKYKYEPRRARSRGTTNRSERGTRIRRGVLRNSRVGRDTTVRRTRADGSSDDRPRARRDRAAPATIARRRGSGKIEAHRGTPETPPRGPRPGARGGSRRAYRGTIKI